MVRTFILGLAATLGLLGTADVPQESDEAWRNLVMKALSFAAAHDYPQSEQLFQKALREAARFGPNDPRVGTTFNSLGLVLKEEKRYSEAESFFRRALGVLEKAYGYDSIDVANINFNIASILADQGKHADSMPQLQKSLATYRRQLGAKSLKSATVLCMIGDAHRASRSWQQAEQPLKECGEIREANGGMMNGELADALFSLARVYEKEGKYALADPRFRLAEKIREKTQGVMSPGFAEILEAHSAMLKAMGRDVEAQKDASLAEAIRRNEHKGK